RRPGRRRLSGLSANGVGEPRAHAFELVAVGVELAACRPAFRQETPDEYEPAQLEQEVVDLPVEESGVVLVRHHAASSSVATASLPSGSTSAVRRCGSTKTAAMTTP